jgi:hypothetical protein
MTRDANTIARFMASHGRSGNQKNSLIELFSCRRWVADYQGIAFQPHFSTNARWREFMALAIFFRLP